MIFLTDSVVSAAQPARVPGKNSAPVHHFTYEEAAARFDFPANGAEGQTIGIVGFGRPGKFGVDLEKVRAELRKNSSPVPPMEVILVNVPSNGPNLFELHMDAMIIATLAPKASIRIYLSPEKKLDEAFRRAVDDGCSVISFSFGHPQGPWDFTWDPKEIQAVDASLAYARDHKVTVCVASGDSGAGRVAYPASSPWALAVGGVSLTKDESRARAWQNSGGGVSNFPVPHYQARIHPTSFPDRQGHTHEGRGIPDVAAFAVGLNGFIGTSAGAPFWAALIARINTALGHNVGFINPIIYRPKVSAQAFHDIVDGDNIPRPGGKYPAKGYHAQPGWDACTGLGTPIGTRLLEALQTASAPN